jgi:hypothetical protein
VKIVNRRASTLIAYHHCGGCRKEFPYSLQIVVEDLEDEGFKHFKTIHNYKFLNLATGVQTQNVEWMWDRENSITSKTEAPLVTFSLAEFVWRRHSKRK